MFSDIVLSKVCGYLTVSMHDIVNEWIHLYFACVDMLKDGSWNHHKDRTNMKIATYNDFAPSPIRNDSHLEHVYFSDNLVEVILEE